MCNLKFVCNILKCLFKMVKCICNKAKERMRLLKLAIEKPPKLETEKPSKPTTEKPPKPANEKED